MFKTSDECDLQLISYTLRMPPEGGVGDEIDCDDMPVRAARASFGAQDKTGDNPKADIKLMNFLAEHGHLTPFEYQHATFLIECPLFIRSQIHRHRTFSYNEISRRYTKENLAFWVPDAYRGQSSNNKQASSDDVIVDLMPRATYDDPFGEKTIPADKMYRANMQIMLNEYQHMIDSGIAREIARAVLPQSLLTQFYMGGNLRNWAHFIALRVDEHAQKEVQIVAHKIAAKLRELWPESCNALGI